MRFPVLLEIRRSVRFILLLSFAYLTAFWAVWLTPLAWQLRALLVFLVLGSAWKVCRPPGLASLRLVGSSRIEGVLASGVAFPLAVSPRSVVFPQFVLLRYYPDGESKLKNLVVFPDHMDEGRFHQLSLWLRAQSSLKDGAASDHVF